MAGLLICWFALFVIGGAASAQVEVPDTHSVSIGDELALDFLDDEAEPYPMKVGYRGEVQMPFLGTVEIAGLALSEVRDRVMELYVANEIFVAPQIEISVTSFQPISVLGDVRTPGLFDFMPLLTVEQAVGLAGGALTPTNTEESRTMQRAALRGELRELAGAIASESAAVARLQAQLAGKDTVDPEDLNLPDVPELDTDLLDELLAREEKILRAEAENHSVSTQLLSQSIAESETQMDLIQQQIAVQKRRIETYGAELAASLELARQGLQAAPVRARLERQVAEEDSALLGLELHLAQTRRELSNLKRERQTIMFERSQAWRAELTEREVGMASLLAQRASIIDRLNLLADWSIRLAASESEIAPEYQIRRRGKDGIETIAAEPTDEVLPGDVVLVRVAAPDARPAEALVQ